MTEEERREMVAYRIERAKETFKEVEIQIENELWATAINRLYYACFYAVSGLLLKKDVKVQSHSGTRQMFGLHFIKTNIIPKQLGKFYSNIFNLRHTGDYDDFVEFDKNDVIINLDPAKELIQRIEELVKQ
jgi:uncharacterized protein (UPF0332 family)